MKFLSVMIVICGVIALTWLPNNETEATPLKESRTIALLIDNSSTTAKNDRPAAMDSMKAFLGELTSLQRRKATRDTQILIVLTTLPNRIAWKGSAQQLRDSAADILPMLEFKETCSDLVLAFEELDTALRTNSPDKLELYSFSPLVNVPFSSCGDDDVEVLLPQAVPQDLLLEKLAKQAEIVKLFLVADDQKKIYLDYLTSLNLNAKFDLQGLVGTRAQLSQGGGRE